MREQDRKIWLTALRSFILNINRLPFVKSFVKFSHSKNRQIIIQNCADSSLVTNLSTLTHIRYNGRVERCLVRQVRSLTGVQVVGLLNVVETLLDSNCGRKKKWSVRRQKSNRNGWTWASARSYIQLNLQNKFIKVNLSSVYFNPRLDAPARPIATPMLKVVCLLTNERRL